MILKELFSVKRNCYYYKLGIVGYVNKHTLTNWEFIGKEQYICIKNSFNIRKVITTKNTITYFIDALEVSINENNKKEN